jgi:hypothetical protein
MTTTTEPRAIPLAGPAGKRRSRRRTWRPSLPAALLLLAAAFGVALLAPVPVLPDQAEAAITQRVAERLPGWRIQRALPSWEGAWTVVATCGDRHVGFQMVPGHGLRPGDAWLHPEDEYSYDRLARISDDRTYLVWFGDERHAPSLSCRSELARQAGQRVNAVD